LGAINLISLSKISCVGVKLKVAVTFGSIIRAAWTELLTIVQLLKFEMEAELKMSL